jgi:hypothetical protein
LNDLIYIRQWSGLGDKLKEYGFSIDKEFTFNDKNWIVENYFNDFRISKAIENSYANSSDTSSILLFQKVTNNTSSKLIIKKQYSNNPINNKMYFYDKEIKKVI